MEGKIYLMRFPFHLILVSSCTEYNPLRRGTFKDRNKKVVVVVGLLLETNSWVCGSWEDSMAICLLGTKVVKIDA